MSIFFIRLNVSVKSYTLAACVNKVFEYSCAAEPHKNIHSLPFIVPIRILFNTILSAAPT